MQIILLTKCSFQWYLKYIYRPIILEDTSDQPRPLPLKHLADQLDTTRRSCTKVCLDMADNIYLTGQLYQLETTVFYLCVANKRLFFMKKYRMYKQEAQARQKGIYNNIIAFNITT